MHNDKMDRFPRSLKAWHYEALLRFSQGERMRKIADDMGFSYQTVKNALNSPLGKQVLDTIRAQTISTIQQVQTTAQLYAPEMIELLLREARGAMESSSRVRAQMRLLDMAGHKPIQHVVVERPDEIETEFKDLNEDQLREKVLAKLGTKDKGPDGKMLS
jgi:hypothetical protein